MTRKLVIITLSFLILTLLNPSTAKSTVPNGGSKLISHTHSDQYYPLVYHHKYGDTLVERAPKRIVTLGWASADLLVSLRNIPIAMAYDIWGGDEKGYLPWIRQSLEDEGKALPELIRISSEVDIEKLILLKPDLIIATQFDLTASEYRQLSTIAPVIANPGPVWTIPVEDHIRILAALTNSTSRGEAIITKLNHLYQTIRNQNPEFSELSLAYIYAGGPRLDVYTANDPRLDFFTKIGFKASPEVGRLYKTTDDFAIGIGMENADLLNSTDLLILWFSSPHAAKKGMSSPLFASINAIKNKNFSILSDQQLSVALRYATPLSLEWALPKYLPELKMIADKAYHNKEAKPGAN